jgi:hypothetical protein
MRLTPLVLVLAAGCASTSTHTQWKAVDLMHRKAGNVLAVVLLPDEGKRRALEDALVANLQKDGVRAEASWKSLAGAALQRDAVHQLANAKGVDGILVVRFAGRREEVVPNTSMSFDPYWGAVYPYSYGTSWDTNDIVSLESRLFSPNGDLLWSGSTETVNPQTLGDAAGDIARSMAKTMDNAGALAKGEHAPSAG